MDSNSNNYVVILTFKFIKTSDKYELRPGFRLPIWLETNDRYQMPCEFLEITHKENNTYMAVVKVGHMGFITSDLLQKKFLFGHPDVSWVGYGFLERIEPYDQKLLHKYR